MYKNTGSHAFELRFGITPNGGKKHGKFRELDPDADRIIEMLGNELSDRKIAEQLGRKQRTFADQMKKIRTELRKVRGY